MAFAEGTGVINVFSGTVKTTAGDKVTIDAVGSNAKVNVVGGLVESAESTAITVRDNAVVTVDGGIVESKSIMVAIHAKGGKAVVTNGTIKSVSNAVCPEGGTAEIKGGTIISTGRDAVYAHPGAVLEVTGGTFSDESAGHYLADGYVVKADGDMFKVVSDGINTEAELREAIAKGGEVFISGDITLKDDIVVTENVTLKADKAVTINAAEATDAFTVNSGAELTLCEGITVTSATSILYANGANYIKIK